ncbi:MAG: 4-vinyl reductase [Campylobacterota bacterium]|nr:4-vinyl reductase [Campylobacterota bacterium]
MFDINKYEYDKEHCVLMIEDEAMMYHCHHYLTNLQKTIFDAEYIDSVPFIVGSAADSVYNQLSNLCRDKSEDESKQSIEQLYKTFGNGLIDLSSMNENGITLTTTKSILSKTWLLQFEKSSQPVDCYTTGFLAAAFAVIYNKNLDEISAKQTTCMACGDEFNTHIIKLGSSNFTTYLKKSPIVFNETPKVKIDWEHAQAVTDMFADAHKNFIGNEEGFIPAFGVYVVHNQSDYINRVQFEFIKAVVEVAGDYGETQGGELLMEAGLACGFFTLGGILASPEWKVAVQPLLKTKEDWINAAMALTNNMGWGYQMAVEVSKERLIFRNYNDFEDLSYMRMYGKSKTFTHWANSGGWSAIMPLIYNTDLIEDGEINSIELFGDVRRSKYGYKINRTKGISCGDDFLEVEIYL